MGSDMRKMESQSGIRWITEHREHEGWSAEIGLAPLAHKRAKSHAKDGPADLTQTAPPRSHP